MSNPVFILGAGASHDYTNHDLHEAGGFSPLPPLTDELCADRFTDYHHADPHLSYVKTAAPLIGQLIANLGSSSSLEQLLERYSRIKRQSPQLIAFRYYLQSLFYSLSKQLIEYKKNNYSALVYEVRDYLESNPSESVTFITFNYDTLLEDVLGLSEHSEISPSYISIDDGKINVIKLHGSCDWWYIIENDVSEETRRSI